METQKNKTRNITRNINNKNRKSIQLKDTRRKNNRNTRRRNNKNILKSKKIKKEREIFKEHSSLKLRMGENLVNLAGARI